jgi:hypothetical protein
VILVLVAALGVGGLADRAAGSHPAAAATADVVQPVPVAAPVDAYSSTWFCAGATDLPSGVAPGRVIIYNNGTDPETATVTLTGSNGKSSTQSVPIQPGVTAGLNESIRGGSAYVGAKVDVDGSAAVYQVLAGALGTSTAPCSTSGSAHWYFPTGQTRINAAEYIFLQNPSPSNSIVVDMAFSTNNGGEQPSDFQGVPVSPGGLVVIPLSGHLRRRTAIATSVTARSGEVVAWEEEVITPPTSQESIVGTAAANAPLADPAWPVPGLSLMLGAPSAGLSWVWPDGVAGQGIDEQYVIYNPGSATADIRLAVGLQQGTAEPFDLQVGPGQTLAVVSEQEPRIPPGEPHSARLESTNGVPVVAVRTVSAQHVTVPAPAPVKGIGAMLGQRLSSDRWIVATPGIDKNHQGGIVVFNPGDQPVQVTIGGLAKGPETVTVPAGGRTGVAVAAASTASAVRMVTVQATGPVYTEFNLYATGHGTGVSIAAGVPAAQG